MVSEIIAECKTIHAIERRRQRTMPHPNAKGRAGSLSDRGLLVVAAGPSPRPGIASTLSSQRGLTRVFCRPGRLRGLGQFVA
jgi:hypothetical protein